MLINYTVLLAELVMSVIRHKAIICIWISVLAFDQPFSLIKTGRTECWGTEDSLVDEIQFYLWSTAFISIIGWSSVSIASITNDGVILDHFIYMLPYYGTYVAVFKFCGLAFLIGQRFKYLNEIILASAEGRSSNPNNLQSIKVGMNL
ncbi:hypothetical protein QAD02_016749 [Eretmocerus hayati]|uniref:Uncharacterized protein n=1 Tax=Eretmocerus hayati TaxID=131215 RepID=A0ACC2PCC8_9HYME|nr:hypothetical protein QAD02_016749 [Eretmocerus hayati]